MKITSKQQIVLDVLFRAGPLTVSKIVDEIWCATGRNVGWDGVLSRLRQLERKGLVRRDGRPAKWSLR